MMEETEQQKPKKFFTKINLQNKVKPRSQVYDVYYCVKTDISLSGSDYVGSWVSSIDKDDIYNKEVTNIKISGDETENHCRIRLKGLLETLKWIVGNTEEDNYKYINVNLYCNDPFIVNLLSKWIPSWCKNEYNISEEDERPNKDLLNEIGDISTKINTNCKWLSVNSVEMTTVNNLVDQSLQRLKSQ